MVVRSIMPVLLRNREVEMMSNGWKAVAGVGAWAIGAMLFYPLTACTESAALYPAHYSPRDIVGEPPITQQEIDAYSKIRVETQYATLDALQGQGEAFIALLKKHGLSHKRFHFIAAKIPLVTQVALGQELQSRLDFPDSLKPTPEEIALVERNWEKLVRPGSPSLEAAREQARKVHEEWVVHQKSFREKMERMKKEPPLTQADVDAWFYFEEGFEALYAKVSPKEQADFQALRVGILALYAESGLTKERHNYIHAKIWRFVQPLLYNAILFNAMMADDEADILLSAEETALLQKNQDRIMAWYQKPLEELP